jgi:hypothetical protein
VLMILTRKETAETYVVIHAVVTVPACELSQYIVNSLLTQTSMMLDGRQR